MGAALVALLLLFAAAVLWPAASPPLPTEGDDYLIRNVRVVDVEGGRSSEPADVTIIDGRIAAVGGAVGGAGLRIIDAGGRWLVPGYWDMHVHSFQLSPQLHHPLMIAHGITSVRDMMDCPESDDALVACHADKQRWTREAAEGRRVAPRYVMQASHLFDNPDLTDAEVRGRVAAYAARGIMAMKVYNRLDPGTYGTLADAVRATSGTMLVGHLPKALSLDDAIRAGQRSFEHAHLLARHCARDADTWRSGAWDEADRTMVIERLQRGHDPDVCTRAYAGLREAGAVLVPTHVTREEDARTHDPAFLDGIAARYLDPLSRWAWGDDKSSTASAYPGARGRTALQGWFDHGLRLTGEAHQAGVTILVGTDTSPPGFRYHHELMHLARAGLSPAAVLRAATIDAARFAGRDAATGSVAPGKVADLLLLDADPLADTANLGRIHWVMLGGRLHDRAALERLKAFAERQAASWLVPPKLLWGFATSGLSSEL